MPTSKLDIKFGRRTRSLAKFDVTFPHIIFAQLVAIGFEPNEAAWVAFYGFSKNTPNKTLIETAKSYLEHQKTQEMIKYFQKEFRNTPESTMSVEELIEQKIKETGTMDKESTAMEILRMARQLPDGKERAELMMKYADLKGYKKTEDKVEEIRHTMLYLPATCDKCPVLKWVKENHPDALKSRKPQTDV